MQGRVHVADVFELDRVDLDGIVCSIGPVDLGQVGFQVVCPFALVGVQGRLVFVDLVDFLAHLEDRVFPTFWSVKKGNIEEEKRLFYVAITRAKKRLYLSWHEGNGNQRYAPSRFLQSLDSQYIEVR